MSADWFYLKPGWFRKTRRVGPITEADLLKRIEKGEISPETLLLSESKTKGRWLRMERVAPAMKLWKKLHQTG